MLLLAARSGKSIAEILRMLDSIGSQRYVVVYQDLGTFRKIYSHFAKKKIESNEVVVLLPYYETIDRVKLVLEQSSINVRTQESRGYLAIMDSYATYLGFQQDSALLFSRLVSHALVSKKSGISIMADMGAFFLIDQVAEIARRNQPSAASSMKVTGFCTYHKKDFEKLSDGQKRAIFGSGHEVLMVQQAS
jgi:hypothetical protein